MFFTPEKVNFSQLKMAVLVYVINLLEILSQIYNRKYLKGYFTKLWNTVFDFDGNLYKSLENSY